MTQRPLSATQYEKHHDTETAEDHLPARRTFLTKNEGVTELQRVVHEYRVAQARNPLGSLWLTGDEFAEMAALVQKYGSPTLSHKIPMLCDYTLDSQTGEMYFTENMLHPKVRDHLRKEGVLPSMEKGKRKKGKERVNINRYVQFALRVDNMAWGDLSRELSTHGNEAVLESTT